MRIGVVATSYPRWPGDPAGSFVGAHVRALEALGHAVDVVAAAHPIPPGRLFFTGGAPDRLERAPIGAMLDGLVFSARLVREVRGRARAWDAVVAHWLVPSALAALPTGLPLVAIAHGGDVHTLRRLGLLAPVIALLRRRGARLAFVSEELCRLAGVDPRSPDVIVQPMGIDVARFAAIPPAKTNPPTLLVAARLVAVKGVDVAIRALAHVTQLGRPVRLVIAGDGPDRAALATLAAATAEVTFLGQVDERERDRLLGMASVVVIPSRVLPNGRSEGMPMIALEALAANVPVVASAVGGLRGWSGIRTVPPDDPAALAQAIVQTLAEPLDRPTEVQGLDWAVVAPRLLPTAQSARRRTA
ncbi:MAG: glycosyltransferase family 4 protein [Proteobacteria bacterium]|nr:glycosyltransferase family 4 protein [Pseudomonadota bacterium]